MSRTDRDPRDAGFTLVEMLVALAVFGIAALALLNLVGVGTRSAGAIDRQLLAGIVAQNVLTDAVTDPAPPPLGTTTGAEANGGVAWRWTRRVSRPDDERLLRIDVVAAAPDGGAVARLTSVRGAAVPQ